MNLYVELVKRWLEDPMAVSQVELDTNSEAANAAAATAVALADREALGNVSDYSAEAYAAAYCTSAAHAAAHWEFARAESSVRAYLRVTR